VIPGAPLTAADLKRHADFGIPPELLAPLARRVTDREARDALRVTHSGDLAGVLYARVDPVTGQARGYRVRRDHPEVEQGKERDKYLSSVDRPVLFLAPGVGPLLSDPSVAAVIVEAEKSALALTAAATRSNRQVLALATGGCWGWRGRIGKMTTADGARVDETGILPDFDRIAWRGRDAVILFDANAATNPKVQKARRALARELGDRGARVRLGEVPSDDGVNGPDDLIAQRGDAAVWAVIDAARSAQPASAADVLRLAGLEDLTGLSVADLETPLRALKDGLQGADSIRRRIVRELLTQRLKAAKISGAAALADTALCEAAIEDAPFLTDDAPWPEPVDGARLLDQLVATVTQYVVVPQPAAQAIALWIVLTYCHGSVNLLPLLLITSPTKRCGKTKTVEVVSGLACRALPASNITAAALYRAIDRFRPTLILDEGDTFINDDPELRGVINAGHTRHTACVIRCERVGDDHEPTPFSTWCPKLVAMIGLPKDTVIDRSIMIKLERKAPGERVEPLRADTAPMMFSDLRRQIRRWADDHAEGLRAADPAVPGGLHDRAADNARPLLAIADAAGGDWPARARQAIVALAGHEADDEPSAEALLADLHAIFEDEAAGLDRLSTAQVTELLVGLDSKRWATFNPNTGKPLTQNQVARLLRRFNVRPSKQRIGGKPVNCYLRADLAPVWARYTTPSQIGTPEHANESGPESTIADRNAVANRSDLRSSVSPMNPASVPVFRPDDPSAESETDDQWLNLE